VAGSTIPVLGLLTLLGLVGGIGITALGPGGVIPTIGLFALTRLSATEVAGTAIVTYVAAAALGAAAYTRSGQLRDPDTRRTAAILAGTAVGAVALSDRWAGCCAVPLLRSDRGGEFGERCRDP
jgi:membrane protein implicated in regulation of membrane protease activity